MRSARDAVPSPSARRGGFAWLAKWWRKPKGQGTDTAMDPPRPRLSPHALGFREFTAPKRMQQGGVAVLRPRAFGQRTLLVGANPRRELP